MNNTIDLFQPIIKAVKGGMRLHLDTIYNLKVPKTWSLREKKNSNLHMIYIKNGHGFYHTKYLGNIELKQGRILFVSNDLIHSATPDLNSLPDIIPIRFSVYNVHLSKIIDNFFDKSFAFFVDPNNHLKYRRLFKSLYSYHNSLMHNKLQMQHTILVQIILELYNTLYYRDLVNYDQRILLAKDYIINHIREDISITLLAKLTNLSTKQFSRLFKLYYGLSPYQYVLRERIRYARFLLEETHLTISEVADYLGYPNPYSFSKQFKSKLGFSPSLLKHYLE